ncbi:MAG: NADP-dependent oxidoreductase [Mariniphaga sp.]
MTRQITLKSRPIGLPQFSNFETREVVLPELAKGQVRLVPQTLSVDPYMRGRMNDAPSYVPQFNIGDPIAGGGISLIKESRAAGFEAGSYVQGFIPWQEEIIMDAQGLNIVDETIAPLSYYLGILGMPGLTAYFGLRDIGKLQQGETVVISGAAGAVGIVAGQLAKLQGCHVVGIAGSDSKVDYLLNELNFDKAINYKTTKDLHAALTEACPSGVDVYFDNVGGEISDAVLSQINKFARIIICGQISLYNATSLPTGPRIQGTLLKKSALMQGFIVSNYTERFPEGVNTLSQLVVSGHLKYTSTIYHGFDNLPEAFIALFEGKNLGKLIVEL